VLLFLLGEGALEPFIRAVVEEDHTRVVSDIDSGMTWENTAEGHIFWSKLQVRFIVARTEWNGAPVLASEFVLYGLECEPQIQTFADIDHVPIPEQVEEEIALMKKIKYQEIV